MKIGVSFLSSENKEETIKLIDESTADYIHVDVMDGEFVENTHLNSVAEIKKLTKDCKKKLDIHLMVNNPNKLVREYAKLKNVAYFTFHYEACKRPIDVINMIRRTNMGVGLAINPETKVHKIIPMLNHVDQVLVMSVKPGLGGQKFMEDVLYKVETLKDIRKENGFKYIISIDGGINEDTVRLAKKAGVDMVVSGSFVTNGNIEEQIAKLR